MSAPNISADAALQRLVDGNARSVADAPSHPRNDRARRDSLVGGQNPFAVIIACADSRVVPELAFDQGLGDVFTIAVAGNVASPEVIGSAEYAVAHLGVNLVVVMGHQSCGAVGAACAGGDNGPHLNQLVAHIMPAVTKVGDGGLDAVVREHASHSARAMVKRSDIIGGAVAEGRCRVVPAYYSLEDGTVSFLN